MKQGIYRVNENMQLTPSTWRMRLEGDVSAVTAPGQFINIRLDGHFLRRPISVCDIDAEGSTVTIIYKVLGQGTEEMTGLKPGSQLDVLSGLGNGYDISCAGERPLLIGGGVGIPPLYLAAKLLTGRQCRIDACSEIRETASEKPETSSEMSETASEKPGISSEKPGTVSEMRETTVILGFNTAGEMYYADEFRALGCRVAAATADGSAGIKGFVTDAFRELASEQKQQFTHFYTCGPGPMLRAVYDELYMKAGISGQMSFEERMGCGFGACMGCSIKTKNGYKRICKDGPVMRTEEIIW